MSPSTVIIGLILLAIIIITVISYMKKMKSGCCGGGDAVSVTPPADNNPARYSHHAVLTVEGMSCRNCSARVESAFNARTDTMTRVNLNKKRADVYTKQPIDDGELRAVVARVGYGVSKIERA